MVASTSPAVTASPTATLTVATVPATAKAASARLTALTVPTEFSTCSTEPFAARAVRYVGAASLVRATAMPAPATVSATTAPTAATNRRRRRRANRRVAALLSGLSAPLRTG